jgi:hypothetical protein
MGVSGEWASRTRDAAPLAKAEAVPVAIAMEMRF